MSGAKYPNHPIILGTAALLVGLGATAAEADHAYRLVADGVVGTGNIPDSPSGIIAVAQEALDRARREALQTMD